MTSDCSLCGVEPATVDGHCAPCHDWSTYWNSLTPQEKRDEDQAMAEYVEETMHHER